ncbi:PD-(D/E)XK nuclease family protein [Tamlana fucoidanivorans]|uniref:PD-(D/E)XK nuclease family protein n=1 Tax=Allotamlana fucoidanivorans TaxID=2583814 RepID=A0A5C4SSD2_9FLAO|nr:PD-(D/E)XK nuclease family protein [Tamlana fucoidanivorans]TNJ47172.1 PD-(D/E)XK nuclease family protein [Tamlana fucoidanivorans]
MTTFIFEVLNDLKKQNVNFSEITFVLPSKRAGVFLKNQIHTALETTSFAPAILSIEAFVEELSLLKSTTNTELLFEFYNTYSFLTPEKDGDTFDSFSKWAQILLQDFNEIDRYLIPQDHIFNYLSAIEDLKHWSLEEPKTNFVTAYLNFWKKLPIYYNHYTNHLIKQGIGYQGLIYRQAVEQLPDYIKNHPNKQFVFLGFNALNTAEETIIQTLLEHNQAQIYWDIDHAFMSNQKHDAALFMRQHKKNWHYFKNNPFHWVTNNYSNAKNISIYGIPKNIGQAKHIGSILNQLKVEQHTLQNTAVVLGDENLLIPVLNSLPKSVDNLNVTMGFPLKSIPLASLFDALFQLHKNTSRKYYYKEVINIISHQYIRPLLMVNEIDFANIIIETINTNNLVYITNARLKDLAPECSTIIDLLFSSWQNSMDIALNSCHKLILIIKQHLDQDKDTHLLSLEYLFRFNELFNELQRLNAKHQYIKDIVTLYSVYQELLSIETLDFQGEPLQGLQIMGMLESRVLDFETVIISSVNEGILPAGKSHNSFIPFDVKLENGLPTYKEKDAVYTYHFYRLLQRAKNIFILYNTEADILTGGEKSRFITQLELENLHQINHQIVAPLVPKIEKTLKTIKKTTALKEALIQLAKQGFSPSSLTNYIRNPIDFYYQSVLKIKDYNTVEETVAANTLGTVVHNTLEDFYTPYIGQYLNTDLIKDFKTKIEARVSYHFKNIYKEGDIYTGKNLIIYEIAKRYISNFLDLEMKSLQQGNTIKILAIEAKNEIKIHIPELDFPVTLKGFVDRVDAFNGLTRIIDYKTGSVLQNQVEVVNWEDITTDYKKYSKSFQVLTYAYMMSKSNQVQLPLEAGIVSFKNLGQGFLKFSKKEQSSSRTKNTMITAETLAHFEKELYKLITEICNTNTDFIEKEL